MCAGMPKTFCLYIDDSGTRNPDRMTTLPAHGYDWFSLGGILIAEEDEAVFRQAHQAFFLRWNLDPTSTFLHSSDIRAKSSAFAFLGCMPPSRQSDFLDDLYALMAQKSVTGIACVIDRPGYNVRYREKYRQRWELCKTAFAIVVERAAKYARSHDAKLRVYAERGDVAVDRRMKGYYDSLRIHGTPFAANTSGKYAPLTADELRETLYDFKTKNKTSPLMQMADLYLWPISVGGYDGSNRTYVRLEQDGKLMDCLLDETQRPSMGIKYSCFENVARKR